MRNDDIGRALRAANFAAGEVETFRRDLGAQRAEFRQLIAVMQADARTRKDESAKQSQILQGMAAGFAASVERNEATMAEAIRLAQAAHVRADEAHAYAEDAHGRLDAHDLRLDKLEAKRWALWVLIAALLFGGGVAVGRIDAEKPAPEARP